MFQECANNKFTSFHQPLVIFQGFTHLYVDIINLYEKKICFLLFPIRFSFSSSCLHNRMILYTREEEEEKEDEEQIVIKYFLLLLFFSLARARARSIILSLYIIFLLSFEIKTRRKKNINYYKLCRPNNIRSCTLYIV